MIPKDLFPINIDIVKVIQFIDNDQQISCKRIFASTYNSSDYSVISEKWLDFADVFSNYNTKKISLYRKINSAVDLDFEDISLFGVIDNILEINLKEFKSYLEKTTCSWCY